MSREERRERKRAQMLERRLERAISDRDIDKIEKAFEEIYAEYSRLVAFVISKYVSRSEDIEELTNDVFVNFSRVLYRIELCGIKFYLVTQAKNSAINFLKRRSSRAPVDYVENVEVGCIDEDKELYRELLDDMKEILSEEEINIILLHSVYERTFAEIARALGKPVTTISSTYHRAIAKYRKGKGIK